MSALRNQERMVHSTCAPPRWGGREGGGNRILTDDPTLGCRDEAGLTEGLRQLLQLSALREPAPGVRASIRGPKAAVQLGGQHTGLVVPSVRRFWEALCLMERGKQKEKEV